MTDIRSVLGICLVETERTEKEVWSWVKNAFKSERFTFFISARSFNNFRGDLSGKLKPVVMLPLKNIAYFFNNINMVNYKNSALN